MTAEGTTDHIRMGIDVAAGSAVLAVFLQWLPPISAVLGIVWFVIQIWESKTLQDAIAAWRVRRKAKKLARLNARYKVISAQIAAAGLVQSAKAEASQAVQQAKAEAAHVLAEQSHSLEVSP